ncbi:hypothetical protein [Carbonactinospora thermoautotrophica]|uniref:hypothetical protein n=1 Tax=Carbonactinospora thermoautotrophica TaxID=1469144 RepID=UPI00226F448F|nr:hypothetical protein [Carbonactinospora thermoautotrophica]
MTALTWLIAEAWARPHGGRALRHSTRVCRRCRTWVRVIDPATWDGWSYLCLPCARDKRGRDRCSGW